ncbi:EAL domain-containing protein [Cellulomonas composti]|uniref:EAL domain-containing protein n=1 Tax=Cellulomonas composti TaxID=266130 RepID=A0A511JEN6_9CELL|nr:EAL domain-containing protein [Cellulomonas composti]GEL96203.1 hypothetical protein CCO02nite_28610 [Cellulomonas composti]
MTAHASPSHRLPALPPVARQPIWHVDGALHGYEYLYRNHAGTPAGVDLWAEPCQEQATASVLSVLETLAPRHTAGRSFVNITRAFLVERRAFPRPHARLVLEVLEHVPADAEVLAGLRRLRALGHRIAIDDFTASADQVAMLPYADYVKIDCRDLVQHGTALIEIARRDGARLVAERVSDRALVERCKRWGFDLLQGDVLGPAVVVV